MSIYYFFFYIWEARKPDLLFADVAQVDKVTFLRFDHRKKPIRSKQSVLWWTGVMKCQIISASCSVAKNYSYNLPIICFLVILSFLWGLHIKLACNNFESYFLRLGSSKINATAIGIFCVKNLCFNGLMSICQSI